jgi:hypothetical protein
MILLFGSALTIASSPSVSLLTSSELEQVSISTRASIIALIIVIIFWIITLEKIGVSALPIGIAIGASVQAAIAIIYANELIGTIRIRSAIFFVGIIVFSIMFSFRYLFQIDGWYISIVYAALLIIIFRKEFGRLVISFLKSIRELYKNYELCLENQ